MEKKAIFTAEELANYICKRYFIANDGRKEISPIKLQKSLYFLFALWGAFVRRNIENKDYVEESIESCEYLFLDKFQAWAYGPVIPSIFKKYKNGELEYKDADCDKIFLGKESIIKETIDELLDELFEVSDFKLVTISHEDKCWQNNFDVENPYHNKEINPDDIINEYACRKSL